MRKIIGVGETVLDIIFRDDQPVKAVPGGSAFNAIVSIGRAGLPCVMATEGGDDHVGDIVTKFLEDNNVDTSYVFRHAGTKSHLSLAFLDHNNDAQYQFYKDHAVLSMHKNMPEVEKGDVVLFGSYFAINPKLRDYVATFLSEAKEKGAILYYDINFRASHVKDIPETMDNILNNMRMASVVRGSAEDFQILFGLTDVDEIYRRHIAPYCDCFIYTNAAKPIELRTPVAVGSFPAKEIKTVSTIGAGDNFNAGFCYGLIKDNVEEAASLATMPLERWRPLIAFGQLFSAAVCQSLDNYIPKNLLEVRI